MENSPLCTSVLDLVYLRLMMNACVCVCVCVCVRMFFYASVGIIVFLSFKFIKHAMWLMAHGALKNLQSDNGWTPLHEATAAHRLHSVQILLQYNADPEM